MSDNDENRFTFPKTKACCFNCTEWFVVEKDIFGAKVGKCKVDKDRFGRQGKRLPEDWCDGFMNRWSFDPNKERLCSDCGTICYGHKCKKCYLKQSKGRQLGKWKKRMERKKNDRENL